MMYSDGIEHLIEHTPTEALEHLLQNAHNLTQIPLLPENPLQQDPPSQNSLPHQNLTPQSNVPGTNVPPGKRPFDSQCSEDNLSNSQSKCAKVTYFDNNMYERTLAKHVQASKENVGLVQKAKLELFRCMITTLFMYAVPPMLESSIRNISVHSVLQIVMDHEEDSLSDAFNLCVVHTIGSSERTIHKVSGSLVEALKVYFTQIRPCFVTNHTKLAIVRYEKADKRPINTELFFVNSIGKTDFRVKSVVDLFISSKKAETKDQYTLKGKVAELMPLSNDPCFKITKLKHAVKLVLSNVEGFDKDDVRNAVRKDQQRYTSQSARALLYFEHVSGKVAINCLESRVAAFFQRQKWTSLEDKNQDVKKMTAQLLILSNNQSIRKSSQVPESSGIRYGGLAHNLPYEEQILLSQRCETQLWPGICLAKMSKFGRCVIATQKFSKDDILMDYHDEVYLNMSLSQVLEKEGVEQEFVLKVKSGASRRIIDASKEICPLQPNIRCPRRLANHSQLKSNGANMKPTVIELFQNGKKIVVFRATSDILPFEQLRFDYNDPIANQLFQKDSQPMFD